MGADSEAADAERDQACVLSFSEALDSMVIAHLSFVLKRLESYKGQTVIVTDIRKALADIDRMSKLASECDSLDFVPTDEELSALKDKGRLIPSLTERCYRFFQYYQLSLGG